MNMPEHAQDPLSIEQIVSALSPFTGSIHISTEQAEKIRDYTELLIKWNKAIALTAIDDQLEIVSRHFGESIFALSAVPGLAGRLADVGAGAGFPGLPLKIARQEIKVALLEPNLKKCAFLNEVTRALGLVDVEVSRSRYEEYQDAGVLFDFVCARALGDYRRLLRWTRGVLAPGGHVMLWLGAEDSILLSRTPGWSWDLPVQIPESRNRVIQIGRPLGA
jgi:16S rRNA (guanine527-N7)-methyltransferase